MFIVDLISRWFHILPAIALVGGAFFMRFAFVPGVAGLDEATREKLQEAVRSRWAKVVMISIALLIASGLWNAASASIQYNLKDTPYNILLGIKILLAMVIFYFASVLVGRSNSAKRFRENLPFWLNVNLSLAVALIMIAGYMKLIPKTPKPPKEVPPAQAQIEAGETYAQSILSPNKVTHG